MLAGAAAVAALLAADLAAGWGRLADARDERSAASEAAAVAAARLTDAEARLADATARLEALRHRLSAAESEADRLAAEQDDLAAALAEARASLVALEAAGDAAQAAGGLTAVAVTALQGCLVGVGEGLERSAADDAGGAVAALSAVAGECRLADAVFGAGGPSAVFPFDFADPFVVRVGDGYYGYATNATAGHVQAIRSADLERWEWLGDALPDLPAWAEPGRTWAPSVLPVGDRFVAYYTARERASGLQCVSRAVADDPAGPFVDDSGGPFVCQRDEGGSIDPSPFVDGDGSAWLLWKSEGTGGDRPATIWSQRLSADGLAVEGEPAALVERDQPWEGVTVEGPSMAAHGDDHYLFFSAGAWNSAGYSVGWARCDGPQGPCTKAPGPLLATEGTVAGPGGQEVFTDADGRLWMAYHAWTAPDVGYPNRRMLHLSRLAFEAGEPVLFDP